MTKEILKLTANFLNLDDLSKYLSGQEESKSSEVTHVLNQLIVYLNYVVREITKDYFPLYETEKILSDGECKIYFNKLTRKAIQIKDIKNILNASVHYSIYPEYIKTELQNSEYKITYSYIPKEVESEEDEIELPFGLDYFIVAYAVASEMCMARGLYEEAQFWESKFLSSLRSIKTRSRERRFFARRLK